MLFSFSLTSCKTIGDTTRHPVKDTTTVDRSFYKSYSAKLGVTLSGKENRDFIREIATWIGTPYKYGGSDHNGTDCSGFTMMVYKKVFNISLNRSCADQVNNTEPVDKKNLKCGDLIFFKINKPKASHVGIYIADNKFVHASSKRGVVVNDLSETYYTKYYYSAGRIKGLK
jgi:cell wall-associated NlpC family hydrolase